MKLTDSAAMTDADLIAEASKLLDNIRGNAFAKRAEREVDLAELQRMIDELEYRHVFKPAIEGDAPAQSSQPGTSPA